MAAEILQDVGALLDAGVEVEAGDAARAAGHETIGLGQHDGRLVEGFDQAGCYDPDNALVPRRVIDDDGVVVDHALAGLDHFQRLLRDLAVDALALVVGVVDLFAHQHRLGGVGCGQQLHGQAARIHAAGRIQPGADLEDDVVDRQVPGLQLGKIDDRQEALAGVLV